MTSNSTQFSHGTRSSGHAHGLGVRSSIASVLRRKGSAFASLSVLFRGSRSNYYHQHPAESHTWNHGPSEDCPSLERPSFYHLEHTGSPPYGSRTASRDQAHRERKKLFWTVSGTRSTARSSSTGTAYTPRMSRARSFVLSLRSRGGLLHEGYAFQEEARSSDEDSCEDIAPILAMPSGCSHAGASSSFLLGVQKALQDTVDETFSFRGDSQPSLSITGSDSETIAARAVQSSPEGSQLGLLPRPCLSLPIWEPGERRRSLSSTCEPSPTHTPFSLSWMCDSQGNFTREKEVSPHDSGIQTLIRAYEHLNTDLQTRKNSDSGNPQQLNAWDEQLGQLRGLIGSLTKTLSSTADDNVPQGAEDQQDADSAKGNGLSPGTQTAENEYPSSEQSRTSSDEDLDSRRSSDRTSVESEAIPGPPASPESTFGGSRTIRNEFLWEMRCTQSLLEARMRRQHPQVNPDAQDAESICAVSRTATTRLSLEDELLQVGEAFDDDGNVEEFPDDGVFSVAPTGLDNLQIPVAEHDY